MVSTGKTLFTLHHYCEIWYARKGDLSWKLQIFRKKIDNIVKVDKIYKIWKIDKNGKIDKIN